MRVELLASTTTATPHTPVEQKVARPSLDQIYRTTIKALLVLEESRTRTHHALLAAERRWHDRQEAAKFEQEERMATIAQHAGVTATAEQVVGCAAPLITAAVALTMGATPFALLSLGYGLLNAVDASMSGALRRQAARWLARTTFESEATWRGRIQIFTAVAGIGLSLGLRTLPLVQIAMTAGNAAVAGVKGHLQARHDAIRAILLELDYTCQRSDEQTKSLVRELQARFDATYSLYDYLHRAAEAQSSLTNRFFT